MKQLASLLVLVIVSAQVDGAWAAAPVLPSAPLADDEDYQPPQSRLQEDEASARGTLAVVGIESRTTGASGNSVRLFRRTRLRPGRLERSLALPELGSVFQMAPADVPLARGGLPLECHRTTPLAPPPLYVFMSLQI